jgi:hypothetical protein
MAALTVTVVKVLLCSAFLTVGAAVADASASPRAGDRAALKVVRSAADSLVARHRAMPQGGWAWQSEIQAPHYQTDRDVGAASIGEGLLAAYGVTRDARYRRAAVAAGDFLLGVSWHWGTAGIAALAAHPAGASERGPGGQRTSRHRL